MFPEQSNSATMLSYGKGDAMAVQDATRVLNRKFVQNESTLRCGDILTVEAYLFGVSIASVTQN